MIPKVLNHWHSENDEHIYMDYSGNAYKVTKIKYVPNKDEKVIKFVNIDWSRALVFKNSLWKYFKQEQLTKLKIYASEKHPHDAQQIQNIDFGKLNKKNIRSN